MARMPLKPGSDIPSGSGPPENDQLLWKTIHLMRLYITHRRVEGDYHPCKEALVEARGKFQQQRELIDNFGLTPRNVAYFFFRHYSNTWMNVFTSRKVVDAFFMNRGRYPPPTYHLTVKGMNSYMKSMGFSPRRTILRYRDQRKPVLPRVLFAFQHDAFIKESEKKIAARQWFRAPTQTRTITMKWYPEETGVLDGLVNRRKQEEGFGVSPKIAEALAADKAG